MIRSPFFWSNVAAACASVFFGVSVVATRFVIVQTNPFTLAFLRYFLATSFIFPILVLTRHHRINRSDLLPVAVLGIIFFGIFPFTFNTGLKHTLASRGALILATIPLLTLLLSTVFRFETITWLKTIGVFLTLIGVATVIGEKMLGQTISNQIWFGDLFILITSLCGAVYNTFSRPYFRKYSALTLTGYSMLFGTIFLLPFAATEGLFQQLPTFNFSGWLAVLYLGLLGGVLGFYLWAYALERSTPTRVAVFVNLNPLTATILAVLLLGETVTVRFVLGFALVLGGIGLTNWRKRQSTPSPPIVPHHR